MVHEAVEQHLEEREDLDFKRGAPPKDRVAGSDIVKDIAAMANSGGGMLLFGVTDEASRAADFKSVSEDCLADDYAKTLLTAARTKIDPPVLDVEVRPIRGESGSALAIVVGPSFSAPHFQSNDNGFRAPYRHGPDTAWMSERMIEAAYRRRLEGARNRADALSSTIRSVFEDYAVGNDHAAAWIAAASQPSTPSTSPRALTREEALRIWRTASPISGKWVSHHFHVFDQFDLNYARAGMRSWRAWPLYETGWREAYAVLGFDGSATLAAAIGGRQSGQGQMQMANDIQADTLETFLANFFAIVRQSAKATGIRFFDIEVAIQPYGTEPFHLWTRDPVIPNSGYSHAHTPFKRFIPIRTTLDTATPDESYVDALREVALDMVRQGDVDRLTSIKPGQ